MASVLVSVVAECSCAPYDCEHDAEPYEHDEYLVGDAHVSFAMKAIVRTCLEIPEGIKRVGVRHSVAAVVLIDTPCRLFASYEGEAQEREDEHDSCGDEEGSEVVTNRHRLKLRAPDGKMRLTDCVTTDQLF